MIGTRVLLPAAAGAACVLGFAPFYAWYVPIVAIAVLLWVWMRCETPRAAGWAGYAFGLALFLVGVSWVYVSLHDFGAMPLPIAALATFLFCAFLALFPALAGWLGARFTSGGTPRLFFAAAAFPLGEWIRGWIFTGFPWLTLGTSQVPDGPLAAFAPYVGAYGTSLAITLAAAGLASAATGPSKRARIAGVAGTVAVFALAFTASLAEFTRPAGPPVSFALLQGNIAQELKWRDEVRMKTLLAYRAMIFDAEARIVVLPETALPAFLDELPLDYMQSLRDHARQKDKDILLGTVERASRGRETDYYNSLVNITAGGSYRKRHLVPFGEFIPWGFDWILAVLHIPMSDFSRGAALQPPLAADGLKLAVAICYEDLFGEEVIDQLPAAQVLVNVSNDAWFGKSFAAEQHLQASQMRARETGRWMVRATNTGASAAIDERGRIVSRLPEFTSGTLVEKVTPREGSTPYVRWGNLSLPWLFGAIMVLAAARSRRRAERHDRIRIDPHPRV